MTQTFRTYFDEALRDLPGVIEQCKTALSGVDFDTIVGTGFSGGVVIPALAMAMDKKFVLIRKENDDSHHGGGKLVGELGQRWIFVDDFISSGRTRERVIRKIAGALDVDQKATMVGQFMYQRNQNGRFEYYADDWAPADLKVKPGEDKRPRRTSCDCSLCVSVRGAR